MTLPLYTNADLGGVDQVRCIVAVASGKGGVGKSTIALHIARSLVDLGFRVGILDADLYGPSIPLMLKTDVLPRQERGLFFPAKAEGLSLFSIGYLRDTSSPTAVRAPIANRLIRQFLRSTVWGDLDFLIIDFPPGTGDIHLSLAQHAAIHGALLVTTPQEIALADVRKAATLFRNVHIPLLGIVENMSYLDTPTRLYPFGQGGGKRLAVEYAIPLLGEVPVDSAISLSAERKASLFSSLHEGSSAPLVEIFRSMATLLLNRLPTLPKRHFPFEKRNPALFSWDYDGQTLSLPATLIQQNCPCAACALAPPAVDPNVLLQTVSPIGRYALRFRFSSGCSHGLYPFSLLDELCQKEAVCAKK